MFFLIFTQKLSCRVELDVQPPLAEQTVGGAAPTATSDAEPADVAMKTEQPAEPTPVTGEPMEVEKSTGRFFYVAKGSYCI